MLVDLFIHIFLAFIGDDRVIVFYFSFNLFKTYTKNAHECFFKYKVNKIRERNTISFPHYGTLML